MKYIYAGNPDESTGVRPSETPFDFSGMFLYVSYLKYISYYNYNSILIRLFCTRIRSKFDEKSSRLIF